MLRGKLALVTGGANSIGLAIAKLFAKEHAVVAIADIDKNMSNALKHLKSDSHDSLNHTVHYCDVSKPSDVKQLFKSLRETYPDFEVPNVIVNNAGVHLGRLMIDLTEHDYDKVMDINVKGTFLVTQEATKRLIENFAKKSLGPLDTYASIINISSLAGKNGCKEETHYGASKAAVEGLTRSVAKEMGQYRIRCNAVLPGLIRTPMLMSEKRREQVQRLAQNVTLGRIGEPEEVGRVCLFLASEMSSYLNGTSIDCNGGLAF